MISKVLKYYPSCYWALYKYNKMLCSFRKASEPHKEQIAFDILLYASQHGMGWYVCPEIEDYFIDKAATIPTDTPTEKYEKDSFLHVLTYVNTYGGHTRMMERWIQSAPKTEKHSVVILEMGEANYYPQKEALTQIIHEHNGDLFDYSGKEMHEKAKLLRQLASSYEYVISHVHMYDPTIILAFGVDDFTRPVIHFNHSDDKFWCGASVIDMVADLRDNDWSKKYRGIENRMLVRLPQDEKMVIRTKEESRKLLGIPQDEKMVLTCGQISKFHPLGNLDFVSVVAPVMEKYDNVRCYGIGVMDEVISSWKHEKFKALGFVDYSQKYFDYINACDIFINSFPVGGGTAIMDALQCKKPCLSYSVLDATDVGPMIQGVHYHQDLKEFQNELSLLIENEEYTKKVAEEQSEMLKKYHSMKSWQDNIKTMISRTPETHRVKRNLSVQHRITDDSVLINIWFDYHRNPWDKIERRLHLHKS